MCVCTRWAAYGSTQVPSPAPSSSSSPASSPGTMLPLKVNTQVPSLLPKYQPPQGHYQNYTTPSSKSLHKYTAPAPQTA
eukprot:1237370-Rhodomonas_salina.2